MSPFLTNKNNLEFDPKKLEFSFIVFKRVLHGTKMPQTLKLSFTYT